MAQGLWTRWKSYTSASKPGVLYMEIFKSMYFWSFQIKMEKYTVLFFYPSPRPTWVHGILKIRVLNSVRLWKTVYQTPSVDPESEPDTPLRPSPPAPRTLDSELRTHSKASEPGWEWAKLSFVLELKGAVQDEELCKAQKKINSALQSSLQAGFELFRTNLQNDHLQHRRYLLTSSGDEAKCRAAVVASLEERVMTTCLKYSWFEVF